MATKGCRGVIERWLRCTLYCGDRNGQDISFLDTFVISSRYSNCHHSPQYAWQTECCITRKGRNKSHFNKQRDRNTCKFHCEYDFQIIKSFVHWIITKAIRALQYPAVPISPEQIMKLNGEFERLLKMICSQLRSSVLSSMRHTVLPIGESSVQSIRSLGVFIISCHLPSLSWLHPRHLQNIHSLMRCASSICMRTSWLLFDIQQITQT